VLVPLGHDTQGEGLGLGHRLVFRCPIGEHTWKLRHLGEPAAIVFPFTFKREIHVSIPFSFSLA